MRKVSQKYSSLLPGLLFHVLSMAGNKWKNVASIVLQFGLFFPTHLQPFCHVHLFLRKPSRVAFRDRDPLLACLSPVCTTGSLLVHHHWDPWHTWHIMNLIPSLQAFWAGYKNVSRTNLISEFVHWKRKIKKNPRSYTVTAIFVQFYNSIVFPFSLCLVGNNVLFHG